MSAEDESQLVKGLRSEIARITKERDSWKQAWLHQRDCTGQAWWEGYRAAFNYIRNIPMPYLEKK